MRPEEREAIVKDFIEFCKTELGIDSLPKISFTQDRNWAVNHRSFGAYAPEDKSLIIYIGNRNLADTLRTLAHELVHHKQNELGHIQSATDGKAGTPIENQANSLAGVLMRNYGKINDTIYEACVPTLKEIYEAQKGPSLQIYCDMDGVLCDFDARFEYYFDTSPDEFRSKYGKKVMEEKISEAGTQFWAGMKWMPGGQELWSTISKRGATILSSPGEYRQAEEGKQMWIENNLSPQPKSVVFKKAGHKHEILAGKSPEEIKRSILIDDYYKNILPWKEAGGIGLYYRSASQVLGILAKFNIK